MLKKIGRTLLAGAGTLGALALVNRGLGTRLPVNHLGGTQRTWTWRGYDIFVTEAGEGSPVLLVHGIYAGASSYEYRRLFRLLAQHHRVVAIDLLGCGLSEKPNIAYSGELFIEQIVDALGDLFDEPITLIGSSLGAAYSIVAAARAADRVAHLVAICPVGLDGRLSDPPDLRGLAIAGAFRSPIVGEAAFNVLASKPSISWYLGSLAYGDRSNVTSEIVNDYFAVAHQPGARYVPAAFVGGLLSYDIARDLPFVEAPILFMWGKRAKRPPAREAANYAALAKHAETALFVHSALLPHDEEAGAVAERIEHMLRTPV